MLNIVTEPLSAPSRTTKKRKNNKFERRRNKGASKRAKKWAGNHDNTTLNPEAAIDDGTDSVVPKSDFIQKVIDNSLRDDAVGNQVGSTELEHGEDEPMGKGECNRFPDDEKERARYLAEFHARPLELDRRAGALSRRQIPASKESSHLWKEAIEWQNCSLHERLIQALAAPPFGLKRPTVIQSKAIPAFFQGDQKCNLLIHSETGSGKTLAYFLPILQSLAVDEVGMPLKTDRARAGTRCVILCPTRELAVQTLGIVERVCCKSFNWIVPGCLFGEEKRKSEKARIRKGLPIVIATPGRFLDHLCRTESLLLALKGKLQWFVLDEADRLLDMGLGPQIKEIVQRIRANQPGSGHQGITWRSCLVSATVTKEVEQLAKESILGDDQRWTHIRADEQHNNSAPDGELCDSTPRQLAQFYMTVSAKFRLAALVAFLVQRVEKRERAVVFISTCASVDFYHALFNATDSILEQANDEKAGIFGRKCKIFKLHGNVQHLERQHVLSRFSKESDQACILLATDVAARGLNLTNVDWTVQYDPPSEVNDYVHRAGRVARAGKPGNSLIFMLPSELPFLDVLKKRGIKSVNALSLAGNLSAAANICEQITRIGSQKSGQPLVESNGRSGEAFNWGIQHFLEESLKQDDLKSKTTRKDVSRKRTNEKPPPARGLLMELAQNAFLSHIRAYPTREKTVRQIFCAKALHLGHVARSFALRDPPKKLAAVTKGTTTSSIEVPKFHNSSMTFDFNSNESNHETSKKINKAQSSGKQKSTSQSGINRRLLLEKAIKMQNNGMDSF